MRVNKQSLASSGCRVKTGRQAGRHGKAPGEGVGRKNKEGSRQRKKGGGLVEDEGQRS